MNPTDEVLSASSGAYALPTTSPEPLMALASVFGQPGTKNAVKAPASSRMNALWSPALSTAPPTIVPAALIPTVWVTAAPGSNGRGAKVGEPSVSLRRNGTETGNVTRGSS